MGKKQDEVQELSFKERGKMIISLFATINSKNGLIEGSEKNYNLHARYDEKLTGNPIAKERVQMKIGVGRCEMELPDGFLPAEGFVKQVHPLYVRVLFLAEEEPFALVSIEMTSLADEECARLRKETAILLGIAESRVWISVTHTFSAPHILPDMALKTEEDREHRTVLRRTLSDAVRSAVWEARQQVAECELILHQGESRTFASRDIELPEGWWIGCCGTGPSDPTLTVLEIRQGESVKGLLLHLNTQSSVLDGTGAADGKCVSGDYVGIACMELEKRFPGAAVLFMIGAAGDQAPVRRGKGYAPDGKGGYAETDLHEEAVAVAQELGHQLKEEVLQTLNHEGTVLTGKAVSASRTFHAPAKKMNRNLRELKPTHGCEWELDGDREQTIELFALGDLAIVGVRPELTCITLRQIQEASPYPVTLLATLINGASKYMADQSAYDRYMYEAINSPFAPGAAEQLVREAAALLRKQA